MNAQEMGFTKGNIALTGAASYSSSDNGATTNSKTSSFTIMPSAMYMIKDNIGINAGLGFNSTSSPSGTTTFDQSQFMFGVGGNYYFMKGQFSPFLGLGFSYGSGASKLATATVENKFNTLNIALTPGVNYFVSKNWALSATIGSLGYTSTSTTPAGSTVSNSSSNMNIGVDFTSLGFGISYIIK